MADNGLLTKEGGSDTLSSDGKRPCGGLNRRARLHVGERARKNRELRDPRRGSGRSRGSGRASLGALQHPGFVTTFSSADIGAKKYTPGMATGNIAGYRGPCRAR